MTALDPAISEVIERYPAAARQRFLQLRQWLLAEAAQTEGVGAIEETLKWGEPAYLTPTSRSGTTIRLAWKEKDPLVIAVFLNCRTTLVDDIRTLFPALDCAGNRAIRLPLDAPMPEAALRACFAMALTYHQRRRAQR